jgi:flagellar secretion chaperone FliS
MSVPMHSSKLATYSSVANHGGVAADDPHRLVLMLMDGALERIAMARGCLQRKDFGQKAALLQRILSILSELRSSLDMQRGGTLARNLDDLYGYMERQLIRCNCDNNVGTIDEVASLLVEIRSAWVAVPLALKSSAAGTRQAGV